MRPILSRQLWTIAIFLGLWELVGRFGSILKNVIPPFSEVVAHLATLLFSGQLGPDISVSVQEIIVGFVVGLVLGMAFGFLIGAIGFLFKVFEPLLYYFSAIPKIILFPILLLVLGTGLHSKMGMAAVSAFFPIAVNTALALRQVKPIHVRAAKMLGAGRRQTFTQVYLPSMLGPIMSGMRLGLGVAIVGALLAESVIANAGVGYRTVHFYSFYDIPDMYATILLIFIAAFLINAFISKAIEKTTHYATNLENNPYA